MIDLGYWIVGDESIPVAIDNDGQIFFPGYDVEVDLAAEALGLEPSLPMRMIELFEHRPTDALLRIFPIEPKTLCKIAVKWNESNELFTPPEHPIELETYKEENIEQWSKNFLDLAKRTCTPPKTMGQVVLPGKVPLAKSKCEKLAIWLGRMSNSTEDDEFMPEWMGISMSVFYHLLSLAEIAEDEQCERFPLCEEDAARTLKNIFWNMYEAVNFRYGRDVAEEDALDRIVTMAKTLVETYGIK